MKEVIEKGNAVNGTKDKKWYIPHYRFYHAKKPDKVHVVSDCSAKGTSLNDHLLSDPDILNNLTGVLIHFSQHPVALI